jgi:AraC family transcriptional regulator
MTTERACEADRTLSVGGIHVRSMRYSPGAVQRPHEHASGAVTLVYRGGLVERVGDQEERAGPLSVVVKPPGVRHANRFGPEGASALQIAFEPATLDAWGAEWRMGAWRWIHEGAAARPLLSILASLRHGPRPEADVESLIYDLCAALAPPTGAAGVRDRRGAAPPRWLRRVHARLLEDPSEPQRVTELAREAGVHPVSLARAFRRHYGAPVTAVMRRRRIALAAAKLSGGGQSLCDVALGTGFADQAHFCRVFKGATGVTPLGYRRLTRDWDG